MIWLVLAALGVPLWLLAGVLLLVLRSRRRFRRRPEVFACHLHPVEPTGTTSDGRRRKRYAYWVHDVLLVHRGLALMRYDALPVTGVDGPTTVTTTTAQPNERRVQLRLNLDDAGQVDLLAREEDVARAIGPFFTASTI